MKKGEAWPQFGRMVNDDTELSDGGGQERTLILKAVPRSKRVELIEQGARK